MKSKNNFTPRTNLIVNLDSVIFYISNVLTRDCNQLLQYFEEKSMTKIHNLLFLLYPILSTLTVFSRFRSYYDRKFSKYDRKLSNYEKNYEAPF